MKKLLIVTTINDLSVPLFLVNKILTLVDVHFCFFHEEIKIIKNQVKSNEYNFIYIRDPFTFVYNKNDLDSKLNFIINNKNKSYLVDSISSNKDIYFEDKLLQYTQFGEFMPKTKLLSNMDNKIEKDYIIKKRISSRSSGIFFNKKDLLGKCFDDYIVQEKIPIEKEYRVYCIFDEILEDVSIKQSKTEFVKTDVVGAEKINLKLKKFVKRIIAKNKFDLIGLDIAFSQGKYFLIEINRSPQFKAFFTQTGINLAESFIKKLLQRFPSSK